jgi:hypothetical protein
MTSPILTSGRVPSFDSGFNTGSSAGDASGKTLLRDTACFPTNKKENILHRSKMTFGNLNNDIY